MWSSRTPASAVLSEGQRAVNFPGQVGDRDGNGGFRIAVEESVVHLPAQGTKGIDGTACIAEPQGGQVRPGEVADATACGPDGHYRSDELGVGVGKTQRDHISSNVRAASPCEVVQDLCFFLEQFGVRVEGIGTTTLTVHGIPEIDVDYSPSEDPVEAMSLLAAAVVTGSELTVCRVPVEFLEIELAVLEDRGRK